MPYAYFRDEFSPSDEVGLVELVYELSGPEEGNVVECWVGHLSTQLYRILQQCSVLDDQLHEHLSRLQQRSGRRYQAAKGENLG